MKNLNLKKLIATAILASVISTSGGTFIGKETALVSAAEVSGSITVTTSSLWTYGSADWNARTQIVNRGATFTLSEKLIVNGKEMYGLTNGSYITANPAYISANEVAAVSGAYKITTENLNMRTGNSTLYGVILTIPKGSKVEVLSSINGWDQLIYNGRTGWASNQYLAGTSAPAPTPAAPPAPAPVQSTTVKTTTNNLNMRSGNSTGHSIILTIPKGASVEVLATSNGWDQITYNGKTGWAANQYLTTASAPAPAPAPAPVQSTSYKTTTNNLNMRTGTSTSHSIILTIPQGSKVEVLATSNGWSQVTYNGKTGWASAQYLTDASQAVNGQDIVDYAKTFLGVKYTWGGNNPEEGFDCSGLVKYVYAHFGITTPRVSRSQATFGEAVSMNDLQPGDLVYFGRDAVSHIGIYIGGNNMLHAPEPGKNVEVRDMSWHRSNYSIVGARRYIK